MRIVQWILVTLLLGMSTSSSQQTPLDNERASERLTDATSKQEVPANEAIDFSGFVQLSRKLEQVRQQRRVPIERFSEMARDRQTIVLDTRSKRAFDLVHLAGAVHLNFSDFGEEKLRTVIPSKSTRILIYCNNNFKQSAPKNEKPAAANRERTEDTNGDGVIDEQDDANVSEAQKVTRGMTIKSPRLALNIPTFINLNGYGYHNVYELADQIDLHDPRLNLVGTEITQKRLSK